MFSKRSQYPNYKIEENPDTFTTLITDYILLTAYIWLRDFISRYLLITSIERFSGVVNKE